MLDLEIDVVYFFVLAAETFMECLQEMHFVEGLSDRVRIVPWARDCSRQHIDARRGQHVVGDGGETLRRTGDLGTGTAYRSADHVPERVRPMPWERPFG